MRLKSMTQKATALMVALLMVVALSACAKNPSSNSDPITTAQEKLDTITSMSYDMTMDIQMSSAEQPTTKMFTSVTGDQIMEPLQMKMNMSMNMGELGFTEAIMYLTMEEGKYISYIGMEDGQGNIQWEKQEVADFEEMMAQYDGKEAMDLYMSSSMNFVQKSTETVNGSKAVRYDGIISKEDVNEVMKTSGTLSQFTSLGMSQEDIEALLKDLGEIPISIWIDKTSNFPVKYEMDMTDIMQALMSKVMEDFGAQEANIKVDKVFLSMTLRDFNTVEKIEIPKEALDS